jgi:peptide/nickel transport system permease protein
VSRLRALGPDGLLGLALMAGFVVVALGADVLAPGDPFAAVAPPLSPPSAANTFGTDDLGRDLRAAVVHGARTSLLVAACASVFASAMGIGIGGVAGFRPGPVDDALMRVTEFVQVVPRFFLAVVVIALAGPGLDRLILVLGLTGWPPIARVVRAETLSLRSREFVAAAHALGAPSSRVLLRHVLPHALPATLVAVSVSAAGTVLLEAGLSFLGLGDPTVMSWGYLAHNAHLFFRAGWWLAVFPGLAIALAVLGLTLVADALDDLLDPRGDTR